MSQRFAVRVPDLALAERVIAEVWAAGSSGVEDEGTCLIVYAANEDAERVRAVAARTVGAQGSVETPEAVEDIDWATEWKRGLTAQVISERLVVRPSFVTHAALPGQLELLIEPGQAFGTGGHASTQLALEWIDELFASQRPDASEFSPTAHFGLAAAARVLDVGTGTGVLALAAVGLGAASAIGVDTDAVAVLEAGEAARRNGLAERVHFIAGSLDALRGGSSFDLVVANLLRSEMAPLLRTIAASLEPGGLAVFSGLLSSERSDVTARLRAVGLEPLGWRSCPDESRAAGEPADDWVAPLARRGIA